MVLIHGTASSPARWADLLKELYADPVLRERYQFWMFVYQVLIGHSQGGLLARMQVTSSDEAAANAFVGPPERFAVRTRRRPSLDRRIERRHTVGDGERRRGAYRSAHLPGARSEWWCVRDTPRRVIAEVRRILLEHCADVDPGCRGATNLGLMRPPLLVSAGQSR